MCSLSDNIMDYYVVSQGKTTIPGVDDGEEFRDTDVSQLTSMSLVSTRDFFKKNRFPYRDRKIECTRFET